jgi:S1-C subfamily serine protease
MRRREDPEFGFRARDLADTDLEDPRLKGITSGLVVDAVEPGSWAALARLETGDVILAVDGHTVTDVDALDAALEKSAAAKPASIVLLVRRGVRTTFVEIQPSWEKE